MCENFNRVFVYMLREFLKQTDPKTIRGVSKERMRMLRLIRGCMRYFI